LGRSWGYGGPQERAQAASQSRLDHGRRVSRGEVIVEIGLLERGWMSVEGKGSGLRLRGEGVG
jgi:hypothetical protein